MDPLDALDQYVSQLVPNTESTLPGAGANTVRALAALLDRIGPAVVLVHSQSGAYGMDLVAYSGPETGNRDHRAFVLKSGSCRFVVKGGVDPASPLLDHHRAHGDGVVDIALEVPDVDKCVEPARAPGAPPLTPELQARPLECIPAAWARGPSPARAARRSPPRVPPPQPGSSCGRRQNPTAWPSLRWSDAAR